MKFHPLYLVFLSLFLSLFLSCREENKAGKQSDTLADSLANRCYSLVMNLQTDSLRMAAEEYMKVVPKYSEQYFKAKQYYLNAFFNAHDYEKVLILLDETEKMPRFKEYPIIVCDYQYTRARVFQYTQKYMEAIQTFQRCIAFHTEKKELQEKCLPTIFSAMLQLMNTYIANNMTEEGYLYFSQLKESPPQIIRDWASRDLHFYLAYLAKQSGRVARSYILIDSAFTMPLHRPTPERIFQNYMYASVIFFNNSDAKEKVIQWLQQAISEAEKTSYKVGIEWSIDMLASIYWQSGRVEEGTELQYKALKMARERKDKRAECTSFTTLSQLYKEWELYEQANDYINQAIAVISSTDDYWFKGNAFNMKGDIMIAINQPDSAIYYYKEASNLTHGKMPDIEKRAKAGIAGLLIDFYEGDSLKQGIRLMREVINATGKDEEKSYNYFKLGKGLIRQEDHIQGQLMLDSMHIELARSKGYIYSDGVLEFVLDYYLSQGNSAKVMQYASIYRQKMDIRYNEVISRKVTAAMIKYQTEKKEQQLKLATAELNAKNASIKLYMILIIALVLIVTGGTMWYRRERRLQIVRQHLSEQEKQIAQRERTLAILRLQEQEQQLQEALINLRDANHQSEQLREQLSDFLSDHNNQQEIKLITPSVLREKGEVKFRRYFTHLHPSFLSALKDQIADITRGEEILCMLIALGQNMDEVANTLCIEKKSVKMSRYRLRKKMNIEQEESLDEFIKRML